MSNPEPRLIDKHEASRRTGIPVSTFTWWIKNKSLPFVQPTGSNGKAYFSTTLIENLVERAEGQYAVQEPDFSEPRHGEEDPFTALTIIEPGRGAVHPSRRAEFDAYQRARAAGKSVAESIAEAEGLRELP